MKRVEVKCPNCSHRFELRYHRGMRGLAAGTGALAGAAVLDGILGAVLLGAIAYAAARAADRYWARRCRICGTLAPAPETRERSGEEVQVEAI